MDAGQGECTALPYSVPSKLEHRRFLDLESRDMLVSGVRLLAGLMVLSSGACASTSLESQTAGHIGCVPEDITITDEKVTSGAVTWVAECHEKRYVCSRVAEGSTHSFAIQIDCTEAAVATAQKATAKSENASASTGAPPQGFSAPRIATGEPPGGAAGFELGATRLETRATCTASSHEWTSLGDNGAACSGPASELGFDARVVFEFCGERSCAIAVTHAPTKRWAESVINIREALMKKYGPPSDNDARLPESCLPDSEFARCIMDRTGRVRFRWKWSSGEKILYRVSPDPAPGGSPEGPELQIVYSERAPRKAASDTASSEIPRESSANPVKANPAACSSESL